MLMFSLYICEIVKTLMGKLIVFASQLQSPWTLLQAIAVFSTPRQPVGMGWHSSLVPPKFYLFPPKFFCTLKKQKSRGVMRLNGTWGKKQVWHPHV